MSHCTCYPHAYKATCPIHGSQDDSTARAEQSLTADAGEIDWRAELQWLLENTRDNARVQNRIASLQSALTAAKPSAAHTDKALEEIARVLKRMPELAYEMIFEGGYADKVPNELQVLSEIGVAALKQLRPTGGAESGQEWTPRKVWELLGVDYQPPLEAIRRVAQAHNATLRNSGGEEN